MKSAEDDARNETVHEYAMELEMMARKGGPAEIVVTVSDSTDDEHPVGATSRYRFEAGAYVREAE